MASLMCRACMRRSHKQEPFHRIDYWTGNYFRAAALWEVGVYVLIKHHIGSCVCDTLKFQMTHLENFEAQKDQNDNRRDEDTRRDEEIYAGRGNIDDENNMEDMDSSLNAGNELKTQDDGLDEFSLQELDDLYGQRRPAQKQCHEAEYDEVGGGENNNDIRDVLDDKWDEFREYLPTKPAATPAAANTKTDKNPLHTDIPRTDALNNQYVRIVHVNGIHHLALVTCECRGQDILPLDLMACRLVPTTFNRVRTLFTTLVLDHFRLSNLEIKASAYQYFQLLRRMTRPTAPSLVPNLYHELRRLSRAWRWMKKLKWAGFGNDNRNPVSSNPGELGNFCAACPQAGINLPSDWKNDSNQYFFLAHNN